MDIVEKLRKQATKTEQWQVQDPSGSIWIFFNHYNSANPKKNAEEWLNDYRQRRGCWDDELEIVHEIFYKGTDELLIEAADEIERLRTQSGG